MAQDVKRGHKTNASKCYYNGGKVPVGLKVVEAERIKKVDGKEVIKKKYEIDEDIAPLVKKVFEMYINNKTMSEIGFCCTSSYLWFVFVV